VKRIPASRRAKAAALHREVPPARLRLEHFSAGLFGVSGGFLLGMEQLYGHQGPNNPSKRKRYYDSFHQ